MEAHKAATLGNDFSRVSTLTPTVPETIRQEYRDEIKVIVKELNRLLPQLRIKVDEDSYALARQETMRLTVYACDDSLDVYTLEALRQHLEGHRQMFATALAEPTEAL